MRYGNRFQFGLIMLTALFLVASIFALLLYSKASSAPQARGPILLASFIAILLGSLLAVLFVLRWIFKPYHRLVDEAERASVASHGLKSKDEAQFVLETFQSVVQQLQEQRTALEKLSAEARDRATSAERFSERIVASLPSALVAFDSAGKSITINAPGRALLGVDGSPMDQPYTALFANQPELVAMVQDCLTHGTVYRRSELETLRPDGKVRRIGATIAPIDLMPGKEFNGVLCLLTDITEVSELREQVALKRNLENLGEMSAGLAHEFKNAVAALHGYVQLLQGLDLNDKAQLAAASLLNEVRNLSTMVTSFLNFARPQPLHLEEVTLVDVIDDCRAELSALFQELKVELEMVEQTTNHLTVRADERMLRQSILNLIRNGAEAIPEGSDHRRVTVSIREEKEDAKSWAIVVVKDTGTGVAPGHLEKIFIPFFTTKSKGHGVGLALAHRVVSQHGGVLTVSNGPDGGAAFTIKLPLESVGTDS